MNQTQYIQELETRIDRAKQVLTDLKAERRAALEQLQHAEVDRLEEHLASTEHKLSDLREASAEAWEEIKDAIEKAWGELAGWIHERIDRRSR
ncbi:hypothetical protein [uncultured Abyssibacter sp.]|uniref:hypothetical protein n=1 Tax=uncultured Abyssibacter sp. TaxID=2320202 RepID=UPI0032B25DE1|tara:strand:+ start:236 stop:514 length:279 start_codon:yes stop_codon:yes gene_type:complete